MASSLLTEAANLIEPTRKILYPAEIPVQHHQLRHFLSTTENGTTYYATRNEIYALKDGRRRLTASVDFRIQCLAAGYGWLCVGGPEKGLCAFLPVRTGREEKGRTGADIDAPLPLDLGPFARSASPEGLRYLPTTSGSTFFDRPRPIYKNIGEEIVNAITLAKLKPEKEGKREETVAVVATNDNTVTIFSLDRIKQLKVLHFDKAMNHACISPDGNLLLACGDVNRAFFFVRKEVPHNKDSAFVEYDWDELVSPKLTGFPPGDHCFTTAFSPDGRLCTIGSQAGVIAKLSVSRIHADMHDDEATVRNYYSSRPGVAEQSTYMWRGAIRSMAFSPQPWDMFAWAESRGRICIADLRTSYREPQVIELTKNDPENVKAEPSVASPDPEHDLEPSVQTLQRLGRIHPYSQSTTVERPPDVRSAADYVEASADRRRLRELLRSLERDNPSFVEDQPRLLDLMRNEIREMDEGLDEPHEHDPGTYDLPPPPRRRSSIVVGHVNPLTSTSHPSSLGPILPHTFSLSTSPSRLSYTQGRSGAGTPSSSMTIPSSTSTQHNPDPWQIITPAITSTTSTTSRAITAPRVSRRSSLEQNLHDLPETRESLQRAQRASRLRAEQLSREIEAERESESQALRAARMSPQGLSAAAAATGTRPTSIAAAVTRNNNSSSSNTALTTTSRSRRSGAYGSYDHTDAGGNVPDASGGSGRVVGGGAGGVTTIAVTRRRSTLEDSLGASHDHLRRLQRDLDQPDRERATLPARASRVWQHSATAIGGSSSGGGGVVSGNGSGGGRGEASATATSTAATFRREGRERVERILRLQQGSAGEQTAITALGDTGAIFRETFGPGGFEWMHAGLMDGGGSEDELEIMGLGWSRDGRALFVATGHGVFELKVNLAGRKSFPSPIKLR